MRVGLFVPFFPQLSETWVIEQAASIVQSGHELEIFCLSGGDRSLEHPALRSEGLLARMVTLMGPDKHRHDKLARAGLRAVRHLPASARILTRLASQDAGRRIKVPAAAAAMAVLADASSSWSFDVIQAHYGPMGSVVDALRELGLVEGPLVVTFHGSDVTVAGRSDPTRYRGLFQRAERLTVNSTFLRDRLLELGAPAARTVVLPMGVDTATIQRRASDPSAPPRLLTVGRLSEEKGIQYAVRALGILAGRGVDFTYTVIGDGPRREVIEALIEDLGLADRIRLVGPAPHEKVLEALAVHDVFLLPGIEAANGSVEAQGRVLVEAQAAELPVVASAVGGIPETVGSGAGVLVPPGDPQALADALERVLGGPDAWERMGRLGRRHVEAHFDQPAIHGRLEALYRSLADRQSPLVSVIIPTRDRPALLRGAVSAVLEQSYGPLELIVVDDGSGVETRHLVRDLEERHDRLRALRHETTRGAGAARNTGAAAARGQYLLFEDDDCRGEPDRIGKLVAALTAQPGAGYAFCRGWDTDATGRTRVLGTQGPWAIGTPAALIRTDVFRAAGGFDPDLPRLQDFDLWARILALYGAVEVPEVLYETVRDEEGISASSQHLVHAARYLMQKYRASDMPSRHLARMHRYLGGALIIRDRRSEALPHFRRAVSLRPFDPRGWLALLAGLAGAGAYRRTLRVMGLLTDGADPAEEEATTPTPAEEDSGDHPGAAGR